MTDDMLYSQSVFLVKYSDAFHAQNKHVERKYFAYTAQQGKYALKFGLLCRDPRDPRRAGLPTSARRGLDKPTRRGAGSHRKALDRREIDTVDVRIIFVNEATLPEPMIFNQILPTEHQLTSPKVHIDTGMGKRVGPRLRELAPRGQRESGGGNHAT